MWLDYRLPGATAELLQFQLELSAFEAECLLDKCCMPFATCGKEHSMVLSQVLTDVHQCNRLHTIIMRST